MSEGSPQTKQFHGPVSEGVGVGAACVAVEKEAGSRISTMNYIDGAGGQQAG